MLNIGLIMALEQFEGQGRFYDIANVFNFYLL